ncbi:MAG TPA: phage recombination protein Bet [Stellaceae bacterium]|jgi:phage recombination protein Bet|nr:phage recombination protein Bet [Stellaceae bacterium]
MTTTVALRPTGQVGSRFNPDQIDLIKRTICKGATNDELALFMYQAEKTGLDPLARQIYSIERREQRNGQWISVRSIQTSIDGFRLIAERSGKYSGQRGPEWCGKDAIWTDVWLQTEPPAAARVGILRSDFAEPCWGVARFDAYAQKKDGKPTRMWAVMADVMLAKCAEALALRKAFPQELSGLYIGDEMQQADNGDHAPRDVTPSPVASAKIEPPHDPETGEVSPHQIRIPYVTVDGMDKSDWVGWGGQFIAAIMAAKSADEIAEWGRLNMAALTSCSENAKRAYGSITSALAKAKKQFAGAEIIQLEEAASVPLAGK